jgi:formylglycine-generating enzyme required for sulfatase activity
MKLGGLVLVLAIPGSFSGLWACGRVVDEAGGDSGGRGPDDGGDAGRTDAPSDSSEGRSTGDAVTDAPSRSDGADASRMKAPDSAADAAVADTAADSPLCAKPEGDDSGTPPSCAPGGPGMTNCGPGGSGSESCCTSLEVAGGTYFRTYDPPGSDGGPVLAADGGSSGEADPARVSGFRLDEYLVTVGRFRQFVAAWRGGYYPCSGSGKHTHLNLGQGLANSASAGTYETGWDATHWNDTTDINPTDVNLECTQYSTWTDPADGNENLPINCVNWYEAYAFCVWDGGFLPSEAEWEYAAAAGSQQREYPWGLTAPGTGNQYAIYNCNYSGVCTDTATSIAPVGYASMGVGYWGQLDLAGEVFEWNLDSPGAYVDPCTDCAYLPSTPAFYRVIRGDNFSGGTSDLVPSNRGYNPPSGGSPNIGFRCARTP